VIVDWPPTVLEVSDLPVHNETAVSVGGAVYICATRKAVLALNNDYLFGLGVGRIRQIAAFDTDEVACATTAEAGHLPDVWLTGRACAVERLLANQVYFMQVIDDGLACWLTLLQ
jgi:hypothetical protein